MTKKSDENLLSVEENIDEEAFEGEDGVRDTELKSASPEKNNLLSVHEPEGLARLRVRWAKEEDNNPYKAVRSFCIDCMGGSTNYVAECESGNCPLWKFRFGCHPLPREHSDEQRQKMRERANENFAKKADNDNEQ